MRRLQTRARQPIRMQSVAEGDAFPSSPSEDSDDPRKQLSDTTEIGQRNGLNRPQNDRLERIGAVVPPRFLRFATVRERTGLSRSTIWRLERRGAFPRHRRISTNAVAWLEQEVNEWMKTR